MPGGDGVLSYPVGGGPAVLMAKMVGFHPIVIYITCPMLVPENSIVW